MKSHLLHMLLYATIVSGFFATLIHRDRKAQVKLGGILWLAMIGGALVLAYLMAPFPR